MLREEKAKNNLSHDQFYGQGVTGFGATNRKAVFSG